MRKPWSLRNDVRWTKIFAMLCVLAGWGVAFTIFVLLVRADACHADTLTARCEAHCDFGNVTVKGPGHLAVALQTSVDSYGVPQRMIIRVKAGEYAKTILDPAFIRAWQQRFGLDCVGMKWRWIGTPPPGADSGWSEVGRWCFAAD